VNATEFGKALSFQMPNASSVGAALSQALRDLGQSLGTRPTVKTAYEDSRDHRSGGAVFVASVQGQPVKGLVLCRLGPTGASVAVVYARPNTPPAEWRRLTSAPAQASGPAQASAPAQASSPAVAANAPPAQGTSTSLPPPAHAPLREYAMPDGTGSVGLADGWQTHNQSLMGGVLLQGPGDARVAIMMMRPVHEPGSQMAMMLARSGKPGLVAPFSTPLEAFSNLTPQMSQMSRRGGGPSFEVDNLVQVGRPQPWGPDCRAALVEYGVTVTGPSGRSHYRALAQIQMEPLRAVPGGWLYYTTTMQAPDATFERDLPVMMQLAGSEKENAEVIMNKARQNVAASKRRNDEVIEQVHQRSMAFDARRADNARAANARDRQADDFDEVIRGTRTVEDTQTGEKRTVDLGDVDRITDKLNEFDSGRYRQIPLRDEVDPVQ
jgi:hypothetical protein